MQKRNQQLLTKLQRRGRAANEEHSRGTLASYFHDISHHELMSAEDELNLARSIEELEIATWRAALSYAPAIPYMVAFIAERIGADIAELGEVAAAGAVRGKRGAQRLERAAQAAAEALCARDGDHRNLDEIVAELARLARGGVPLALPRPPARTPALKAHVAEVKELAGQAAELRHCFVQANLRLVVHIASQYRHYGVPLSDLIQEGNIGLMKAVDRYDWRRGYRFSTYASWWVRHMIGRSVADTSRTVRVPVHVRDANQRMARARRALTAELGRAPTTEELAEATGMSPEKLDSVRRAMDYSPVSLDEPIGDNGNQVRQDIMVDPSVKQRLPFDEFHDKAMAADLRRRLSALSTKEIDILSKRYALDGDREWTLQEIADEYGVSRERIRQIQAAALGKLRTSFEGEQFEQQIG
jgi:RNA polymerase primary sigma factor